MLGNSLIEIPVIFVDHDSFTHLAWEVGASKPTEPAPIAQRFNFISDEHGQQRSQSSISLWARSDLHPYAPWRTASTLIIRSRSKGRICSGLGSKAR